MLFYSFRFLEKKISNLGWLQTTYGHNDDLELFLKDVFVYVVWVQCAYVGVSLSMCECTCATASMWISEDNLKSRWSFSTLFDAIGMESSKNIPIFPTHITVKRLQIHSTASSFTYILMVQSLVHIISWKKQTFITINTFLFPQK